MGRVAIKTLGRGLADPTLTRSLIRERQILARLQHPNIATLLDGRATEHGLPYLVMECVDGEPLDRHCALGTLTVAERLDMFRQACAAVQFAHRTLVSHRDLKPSNIRVSRDGVVKLLDFGIDGNGGRQPRGGATGQAGASATRRRRANVTSGSPLRKSGR